MYRIRTGQSKGILESEVYKLMKEGWIPIGGVSAINDDYGFRLFQAMIKNKKEPEPKPEPKAKPKLKRKITKVKPKTTKEKENGNSGKISIQ